MKRLALVMTLLLSCATLRAETVKLNIGDPAPPLAVKEFVKGESVKSFEKGKIYVIEFWTIRCPGCRTSIILTSKILKKFPGVICIGVNVTSFKKDKYTDLKPFVEKMGDKMDYRVAVDGESVNANGERVTGIMEKTWMYPAGVGTSIPWAFIVDGDQKIAWIGNPDELEKPLEEITTGKRILSSNVNEKLLKDIRNNTKESINPPKIIKDLEEAEKSGDSKRVESLIEQAIKDKPEKKKWLLRMKFWKLTNIEKDPKKQLAIVEQVMLESPDDKWSYGLQKLRILLKQPDEIEAAVDFGQQLIEHYSHSKESSQDKALEVINIAWCLIGRPMVTKITDVKVHPKLARLAVQAASQADELIKGMEREDDCGGAVDNDLATDIVDTLAFAYFLSGDATKAVEAQERALKLLMVQSEAPELKNRLELYKASVGKQVSPR